MDRSLKALVLASTGLEPTELKTYFSKLRDDVPYFSGTSIPVVAPKFELSVARGLYVPQGFESAEQNRYFSVYVTWDDYFERPPSLLGVDPKAANLVSAAALGSNISRRALLTGLAILNHIARHSDVFSEYLEWYLAQLPERPRQRLISALQGRESDIGRRFLYPQAILKTMRLMLGSEEPESVIDEQFTWGQLLLDTTRMVHAVAGTLWLPSDQDGEPRVVGVPVSSFMEFVCSGLFNRMYKRQDLAALLERQLRLWRTYGRKVKQNPARDRPRALLQDATGLDINEVLAFTLGLQVQLFRWKGLSDPFLFDASFENSRLSSQTKHSFVDFISSSIDEIAGRVKEPRSQWDFLAFESSPTIRFDDRLLVLDEDLLIDRTMAGLYWAVHDNEKDNYGETWRHRWTQAYGEMVELLVEDSIHALAPHVAGWGADTTFYTEEMLKDAYEGQICDSAVYFGSGFCLFEIVSGRVSTKTRVDGSFTKFDQESKQLVFEKAEQLNATAWSILRNERALTGHPVTPGIRIYPILVVGGRYPLDPATLQYVDECLVRLQLLRDPRIKSLALIDLDELEMLEGLSEQGQIPTDLFDGWKRSHLCNWPLRNYLIWRFGTSHNFRSTAKEGRIRDAMEDLVEALRLRPEQSS